MNIVSHYSRFSLLMHDKTINPAVFRFNMCILPKSKRFQNLPENEFVPAWRAFFIRNRYDRLLNMLKRDDPCKG